MARKVVVTGWVPPHPSAATSPQCGRRCSRASPARARSSRTGWPSTTCPSTSPHAAPGRGPGRPRAGSRPSASTRPRQFALIAAREAWADAGIPEIDHDRLGVDFATGIGGVWTLLDAWDTLREKGPRRVLPMTVPMLMPNGPAAAVSLDLGARAGARTVVSACASGTEAVARGPGPDPRRQRRHRHCGGTEAAIHPMPIAAFAAMQALSRRNDDPEHASRPYDVTATASSWARAPAPWCSRPRSTPWPAAPGSTPNWPARRSPPTRTTSPPRPRGPGRHPRAEGCRSSGRMPRSTTSRTSTRTPPARRSATSPSTKALRPRFGDARGQLPVSATKAPDGSPARRRRRDRGDVHHHGAPRPHGAADDQPRRTRTRRSRSTSSRPPATCSAGGMLAISNSFGFGGHNAVIAFRSV